MPTKPFVSIVWLRAIAPWLVVWTHLVDSFCTARGIQFAPQAAVNDYFGKALRVDIGQFGVTLFFIVSGFVITHAALHETRAEFVIKRIFRIYPPLIVSILFLGFTLWAFERYMRLPMNDFGPVTWGNIGRSMLIFNGWFDAQWLMNPALWSLTVEVMFYSVTILLLPLLKKAPLAALLFELAIFCLIAVAFPPPGEWGRILGIFLVCAPLFAAQLVYFGWAGKIGRGWVAALLLIWWIADQYAIRVWASDLFATSSPMVWVTLAFLVFAILLLLEERLPLPSIVKGAADMSYSVFLLHGPVGMALLVPLVLKMPYPWALSVALAVVIGASWLSGYFVETPSQNAARTLLKRWERQQNKSE